MDLLHTRLSRCSLRSEAPLWRLQRRRAPCRLRSSEARTSRVGDARLIFVFLIFIFIFFSFQQLVVVRGEVMVGHRLLVAPWQLRPLLFSFRCLSTGSSFLGDYPPFPRSIMFTFAAFCYMLSLVLCVSLIFFAIWHVSIFKPASFIALRGPLQSLLISTQRLRCDACAQWCWTFRRPASTQAFCIFGVCRDVWADI